MVKRKKAKGIILASVAAILLLTSACGNKTDSGDKNQGAATTTPPSATAPASEAPKVETAKLKGEILVDGSSTVFPLTEAAAEEFGKEHPDVRVPVGVSGTGGGFKRFCAGEIAIADASRNIKDEEAAACADKGIEFTELSVAYDGLSVVINKDNDFIDYLTIEELNKIFVTESGVKTWKDVRDTWPDKEILMFSPGADSGTYDYFNEAVLDKKGIRNDKAIVFSEDDNTLVQGVAGSEFGIGYFGFAYYEENQDKLKVVPIDGGKGAVTPSYDTIKDSSYSPLSRPLFIYANNAEMARPEVNEFLKYYINNIGAMAGEVGYVALPDEKYKEEAAKIK
ncbi:PstS family phosphate ABC transporter substrate-binding protein [Paenibacillus sp. GXUN7292]|uniref:PstS family phosphate ABC transporter substrate-binding protein n=1 Tax=Paenibacillus sp. GXUN7292 TaxID=3422499 RepID=UPI003D7DBAD6